MHGLTHTEITCTPVGSGILISLCSSSRRNQYAFITIKTQNKGKETHRKHINNKNSINIAIFKFTDLTYYEVNKNFLLLIRFGIISQLTAFFNLTDET